MKIFNNFVSQTIIIINRVSATTHKKKMENNVEHFAK